MPYPDLGTMYQNGMGASASLLGGQMASSAQAQEAEKLKAMQLENAQSAVMNPLNAQFQQGRIAQQGAELPGIQGRSASAVAQGSEDMQTMTAKVAAKISAMSTQIGNDGMVQMGQDGEKLSHAAAIIANYPPHLQKPMFMKAVQQYGANTNSPMFQAVMQAPDDQFQTAVASLGKGMALAGQKYQQATATADAHSSSQEKIAKGHDDASRYSADKAAESRLGVAQAKAKAMVSTLGVDKAIAHYEMIPPSVRTDEENQILVSLKTQQLQARAAGANAVAPTVLNQKTPLELAKEAAEGGQKKADTGHGDLDIAKLAAAQKLPYDPSKFIYRIGPNGQVQSKPK